MVALDSHTTERKIIHVDLPRRFIIDQQVRHGWSTLSVAILAGGLIRACACPSPPQMKSVANRQLNLRLHLHRGFTQCETRCKAAVEPNPLSHDLPMITTVV
jgi:hypothetical protein